jgi:hypothetical protein
LPDFRKSCRRPVRFARVGHDLLVGGALDERLYDVAPQK